MMLWNGHWEGAQGTLQPNEIAVFELRMKLRANIAKSPVQHGLSGDR